MFEMSENETLLGFSAPRSSYILCTSTISVSLRWELASKASYGWRALRTIYICRSLASSEFIWSPRAGVFSRSESRPKESCSPEFSVLT